VRDDALGPERLAAGLLGLFSAATLILSVVGVWAVVSQSVIARRQEIAIRLVLGAPRSRLFGVEVRRGLEILAMSVPTATTVTFFAERVIGSALFGFAGSAIASAAIAAALVGAATLMAAAVPAWRAVAIGLTRAFGRA